MNTVKINITKHTKSYINTEKSNSVKEKSSFEIRATVYSINNNRISLGINKQTVRTNI
jgi:hypothetical protein